MMNEIKLTPVGIVHSPFREKFGIPRQPGLIAEVAATVELLPPFNREEAVRGLEGFSHLWLIFGFHVIPPHTGSLTVRPPRLGGNQRVGVFASRSTHRPNPLGLSAVAFVGFEQAAGKILLKIQGADLLDGTPVYDIKPYLPYADAIPAALGGFADRAPEPQLSVVFSAAADRRCTELETERPQLRALIIAVLAQDPRPAFKGEEHERVYGVRLFDLDVRWRVHERCAQVVTIKIFT